MGRKAKKCKRTDHDPWWPQLGGSGGGTEWGTGLLTPALVPHTNRNGIPVNSALPPYCSHWVLLMKPDVLGSGEGKQLSDSHRPPGNLSILCSRQECRSVGSLACLGPGGPGPSLSPSHWGSGEQLRIFFFLLECLKSTKKRINWNRSLLFSSSVETGQGITGKGKGEKGAVLKKSFLCSSQYFLEMNSKHYSTLSKPVRTCRVANNFHPLII